MNKSKKTIKGSRKAPKISSSKKINPKILVALGVAFVIMLSTIILFDQLRVRAALTIDGVKYSMDDLKYYFYLVESEGKETDELYRSLFGASYWDMPYDESTGTTMRDVAKSQIVDMAIRYEILYKEAVKSDYVLSDEDKTKVKEEVDQILTTDLTSKDIKRIGFTEEYLSDIISKMTLVDTYQEDIIASFDIDHDAIKSNYDFADYITYDVEYISISTLTTNDEGGKSPQSEEEKNKSYEKINALYDEAKDSTDWSTLLLEDEKELTYGKSSLTKDKEFLSKDLDAIITAMANNDMSEILEDEDAYYLVKMIDNESTTYYDETVNKEISTQENTAFQKFYNDVIENYSIDVNTNYLQSIRVGSITIN